ncbi:MAG: hypothetical protein U0984_18115 [Prosthecobacter sp.]|nr:hypothetical protein [Prosthecobacter sp.]
MLMFQVTDERTEPLTNGFEMLPKDPFDRMRLDPSLLKVRRRFFAGVATVAALIVVATVAHFLDLDRPAEPSVATRPPVTDEEDGSRKIQHVQPAVAAVSLEERLNRLRSGEVTHSTKKDEKFAAPVFEISNETPVPKKDDKAAPVVFEVSDAPTIVAPAP